MSKKIWISIGVIIVLAGLYVGLDWKTRIGTHTLTPVSTSTVTGGLETTGTGGYTITQVPVASHALKMPSLTAQVHFLPSLSLSSETQKMITDKVLALQTTLSNNKTDIASWINLGLYQKMAGDYIAAISSWLYASQISKDDYIALGNIGNTYAYYLHDRGQAEMYYEKALNRAPTQVYLYVQLSNVYKEVFGDIEKARAILDQGLSKVPNDPTLLEAKATLK